MAAGLASFQERSWQLIGSYLASYAARRPVRKVAVVGNAPLAPCRERADDLDSSDLVIRVNSLALDRPGEPAVGSACHAVLLSRNTRITPFVFEGYRRRAYLVMQAGFTTFRWFRGPAEHWPADLGAMPVPNDVVTKRLADRLWPDRPPAALIPTTGTTAVFLAHELFPDAELVATGFSYVGHRQQTRPQTEWVHHSGGATRVNQLHLLDREGALLQSWVDDGSMRLLR